ncbi:MAG: phosphate ABC transporter permease PstA, partial [Sciscionella sp.]
MTAGLELERGVEPASLRRPRLPDWAVGVLAAAVLVAGGALWRFGVLSGVGQFLLGVVVVFIVALTVIAGAVEGWRRAKNRLATSLLGVALLLTVLPLFGVLLYTITKGIRRLDPTFLTHSMHNVAEQDTGGGAYHAIMGTLEQVGIASVLSIPVGILVA